MAGGKRTRKLNVSNGNIIVLNHNTVISNIEYSAIPR